MPRTFPEGQGPLVHLTWARLLEFVRSPGTVFWVFGFPLLLALALGLAFRSAKPAAVRTAVLGQGRGEILGALKGAKGIEILDLDDTAAKSALRTGNVDLLILAGGFESAVIYRFDPKRAESVSARLVVDDALQRAHGRKDLLAVRTEEVSDPGGRYIDFLIPGLIGLNIMGSCMWGIGYAVVDTRKRKLLKRFAATPMHRSHFLLSFMFSRLVFLVAEVGVLMLFGHWVFGVQIAGTILSVGLIAALGAFAFSGLAVLIGARPENTEVASGWMNFVMLPMWLLSGSFFSYERFPDFLHPLIRLLPLTALNDGLRGAINDGTNLPGLWLPIIVLTVWGLIGFGVSLRIFKWQ